MLAPFALSAVFLNGPVGPPRDLSRAVTYVVAEGSGGTGFVRDVLPKVAADVIVRGWFKWHQAPPVESWRDEPAAAHRLGALFGGGITCSALYDDENGLSAAQVRDMATRDPYGKLVDAWGQSGIRHGSLSNPAYIDYLFRWCKAQIDAGADYLFMDERNAALSDREGYDDYSTRDFANYLQQTLGWKDGDPRWLSQFHIDPQDRELFPTGRNADFSYRLYLRDLNFAADPAASNNALYPFWAKFRTERDDHAWRTLTTRIRQYAASLGRSVFISGNGLDPYVDLQVLGVWNHWVTIGGHIDMSEDQIPVWRSIVEQGRAIAGGRVPVVLFHDWGFGNPPFPFLAVPLAEREAWMRTRAAEIYAAGAYFAFPVIGPGGCDASKDGTLPLIGDLTRFYQTHRSLYATQQWLCHGGISADRTGLSLAASWVPEESEIAVHVINRDFVNGSIQTQRELDLSLPLASAPAALDVISPDPGTPGKPSIKIQNGRCVLHLQTLDAYSVVLLRFDAKPDLSGFHDSPRYFPDPRWERAPRNEFRVDVQGRIENAQDLEGIVQGRLHTDLRNPPVFLVDFPNDTFLRVHVRAVATQGARLRLHVSGGDSLIEPLPDRDGKNDPAAKEYDRILTLPIPPGPHRVELDNDGPDWLVVDWLEFVPS
jgi:hypothetical protein